MDLNSSSDEEEDTPVAAPPHAEPTQAPIDPAGGATTESNEEVEVAAEAVEAAEAEAVGGLPGLLLSPSLAGLYVIVGRGAPASGGGDKGLPCPAPPEAAAPPLQPWRSPYVVAAAAEKAALSSSSDEEEDAQVAVPPHAPTDLTGGATTESMDVDEGNEEVLEVEVEAVWDAEEEEEEELDPRTLGVPGLKTLVPGDHVEVLWDNGAFYLPFPAPQHAAQAPELQRARRLGEGASQGVRARDAGRPARHHLPHHV